MLSRRVNKGTPQKSTSSKKAPKPTRSAKQAVHVVFTATIEHSTMKRSDTRVIGVYDNLQEAEELEQKFNAANDETDGMQTKAHTVRYSLPYTSPLIQRMMEP